jgi:hypothetical protein
MSARVDPRGFLVLPSGAVAVWKRSPLGRDYRRLWVANAVSVTGDGVTVTAGPLLAASITHDPLLVAGALFAQPLPWLIFAPLSGVLVDRLEPGRLMVIVDLLRAAVIGGLATSVPAGAAHLAALYGALFILGVGSTVSDTAALSLPATSGTPRRPPGPPHRPGEKQRGVRLRLRRPPRPRPGSPC